MDKKRGSGILLHITSLPSSYGIGDLGPGAYKFVDFLAGTKQSFWQFLPLTPTIQACGNSPYSSTSAFAGNTLFISPELLFEEGLLSAGDIESKPLFSQDSCDYTNVIPYKEKLFLSAYNRFKLKRKNLCEYQEFCSKNSVWLENFALFEVIRRNFNRKAWNQWEKELKTRRREKLQEVKKEFKDDLEKEKFFQYIFFKQWFLLKDYCNKKGISLIGDMPIYVSYDSADVWTHAHIFKLNKDKEPFYVAGVPPDYFSKTGQLWGNPVYQWEALKKSGFRWWIQRMKHNLACFDFVRIDHFRGLVAYWEVPRKETTAINGRWAKVPTRGFFKALFKSFPELPIIAEDLGLITPDVKEALKRLKFPGMKVLLFAFNEDNPAHPYLPHTYKSNCVVYTGTHDNNTVRGWFEKEAGCEDKKRLFRYLGKELLAKELHWEFIRLAMASIADRAIFPLQDILGLGEDARMNKPSTAMGNWRWRLLPGQLTPDVSKRLLEMTEVYGRV